jgi:hypothetical protein
MMGLRFAILREVWVGTKSPQRTEEVMLEYDQEKIFEKMKGYIRLSLVRDKATFQRKFTISQIEAAVEEGWDKTINELKQETVKIA